jgi:addiction module RelB/DinJ family antitoxin
MSVVINLKTDKETKIEAQKIAAEMGLSLSGVLNIYLKTFVRTKKIVIELNEIPEIKEKQYENDRKSATKAYTDSGKLISDALDDV